METSDKVERRMETSDKQKEEWRRVERRISDMQKEEWRLVISRKKNGDQ